MAAFSEYFSASSPSDRCNLEYTHFTTSSSSMKLLISVLKKTLSIPTLARNGRFPARCTLQLCNISFPVTPAAILAASPPDWSIIQYLFGRKQ
jgi:hypothetical protein